MESYQFKFYPYQRQFKTPLKTSHGIWKMRQGIIIQLINEKKQVGLGEIAPLSWFGSETLLQALEFCRQLPPEITEETINSIPPEWVACQFGFESAYNALKNSAQKLVDSSPLSVSNYSGLLPTGEAALLNWQPLFQQGYRTFKWKIGVDSLPTELRIFEQLLAALPATVKLRLDANGGLNLEAADQWLKICDAVTAIEFLEQPLPVSQFPDLLKLAHQYTTPIALDESVATLGQIQQIYQEGWRGIFVIKPCIVGSPRKLRQFCQTYKIDAVFSSVFETEIGRNAALKLAAELPTQKKRVLGFGIDHWFVRENDSTLELIRNIS